MLAVRTETGSGIKDSEGEEGFKTRDLVAVQIGGRRPLAAGGERFVLFARQVFFSFCSCGERREAKDGGKRRTDISAGLKE